MTISIDSSILLDYYQGKTGQLAAANTALAAATKKKTPTAPWATPTTTQAASDMVRSALAGKPLVNENAAQLDVTGASTDYKKLFALYQGLNSLNALTERMDDKGVSASEKAQITKTFAKGLDEVSTYAEGMKLDNLRLTRGASIDMLKSQLTSTTAFGKFDTDVGVPIASQNYTTGQIYQGSASQAADVFQGDVQFAITVKKVNSTQDVAIDLNDMGSTPRSLSNVVSFINDKLKAAGSVTRFSTLKLPPAPASTTTVNGKPVTLSTPPDRWALSIKGDITEKISFAAPATAGAVYLAQTAGKPDNALTTTVDEDTLDRQLLKFQTDQVAGAPPPAVAQPGEAFRVDGRVFAKSLGDNVQAVRATAAAADGSVYVLADVNGATDGQTIKGAQDVALMKYDSAGNLLYARTLGAADSATGMALSVSSDGKVAVAGSITGVMEGDSGVDATKSDSFVTVFDKNGDEMWTQRRGSRDNDVATSVAFGDDGTVYVAGTAKSNMPGAAGALGGTDGYLESFTGTKKPLGGYKVTTNFVTQFGTSGTDSVSGMALNGSTLVTAGVESGHAVLRRFDLQASGAPVAGAVSDLGDLQGGSVAGVSFNGADVVVAGSTRNGSLNSAATGSAYTGGMDAFVATADASTLQAANLSYIGGTGDDRATALTVSNGDVWIAGSAGNGDLPGGLTKVGTQKGAQDGFLARVDVATGDVDWGRRFSAVDGQAAPTAIAVDASGASALDRLGLPKGAMTFTDSQLLTSATSLRAGDQFQIRTEEGAKPGVVTISADDTLQTLASKIQRAAAFKVKVQIVNDGAVQRLQIKPLNDKSTVEVLGGKADSNALKAIGIPEGVVRVKPADTKAVDTDKVYGLTLSRDLDLSTADGLKAAHDQLQTALSTIRTAYRDLAKLFDPPAATNTATSGTVPAYLTNQIKNYQDALNRLTGGS